MKNKGLYVGAVALIAVAIISAVSFSMISSVTAQESKGYAKEILETKFELQNAKLLLRKSTADAAADAVYASGCTFNLDSIRGKLGSDGKYLELALSESLQECSVEIVSVAGIASNLEITVNISCNKEFAGNKVNYSVEGIKFSKGVTYQEVGTDCLVDVKDNDFGECEVDKIDTPATGIGCGN